MEIVKSVGKLTAVVLATAIVTAVATVAMANHEPGHHVDRGRGTNRTIAVTGEDSTFIDTSNWTNVDGAKTRIKVRGGPALIVARFTAETVCHFFATDFCSARVMVGDRQARPASGRDFHIDSYYGGETEQSEKGHAFERSLRVGPGTYTVKVQGSAMGDNALKVDDWSLIVEVVSI